MVHYALYFTMIKLRVGAAENTKSSLSEIANIGGLYGRRNLTRDATSGQKCASESRASSTCPARTAPNDASPPKDTQKGDVPQAPKTDQETAPLGDISGCVKTRETGICGEKREVLDVGDGVRARGKHDDDDRLIPHELLSVALVSAIDAVPHPGLDDVAEVEIAHPTAEVNKKIHNGTR